METQRVKDNVCLSVSISQLSIISMVSVKNKIIAF